MFPPATTLLVDDHLKFDATPYDSEGNSLMGRPVRWASENSLVAAVDQSSGETTGMSAGTVKITAESEQKLEITVNPYLSAYGGKLPCQLPPPLPLLLRQRQTELSRGPSPTPTLAESPKKS